MSKNKLSIGKQYYISATDLGIEGFGKQQYKVSIHRKMKGSKFVIVCLHHYKTSKCNKVTVRLRKSIIRNTGISANI